LELEVDVEDIDDDLELVGAIVRILNFVEE
jgi:hypothetical protein